MAKGSLEGLNIDSSILVKKTRHYVGFRRDIFSTPRAKRHCLAVWTKYLLCYARVIAEQIFWSCKQNQQRETKTPFKKPFIKRSLLFQVMSCEHKVG